MARASGLPERGIRTDWYVGAMERLVAVVQELSHARDLEGVMAIVRSAARELTGADGATFVLRDGDQCYYAEEDAISPLWKGQRFPMETCISGWVMRHAQPALIEDIFSDPRIPADVYRVTFVQSLAMVPIRADRPVGAIGNYWANRRMPSAEELGILQALANVTSVAMENLDLYARLQEQVQALERSNQELGRFAWVASHDLKAPLRAISHLADWIEEEMGDALVGQPREHMGRLKQRVRRMEKLLDDVLEYGRLEDRAAADEDLVDGATLIDDVLTLVDLPEDFVVEFSGAFDSIRAPRLALGRVLCNLVGNAIEHHDRQQGRIEVAAVERGAHYEFSVRDDGPGIDPRYHEQVFEMFATLQPRDVREGSGMGLALVKKTLARHGGEVAIESGPGRGTLLRFTWPRPFEALHTGRGGSE